MKILKAIFNPASLFSLGLLGLSLYLWVNF
jgi:hypothetical protein